MQGNDVDLSLLEIALRQKRIDALYQRDIKEYFTIIKSQRKMWPQIFKEEYDSKMS